MFAKTVATQQTSPRFTMCTLKKTTRIALHYWSFMTNGISNSPTQIFPAYFFKSNRFLQGKFRPSGDCSLNLNKGWKIIRVIRCMPCPLHICNIYWLYQLTKKFLTPNAITVSNIPKNDDRLLDEYQTSSTKTKKSLKSSLVHRTMKSKALIDSWQIDKQSFLELIKIGITKTLMNNALQFWLWMSWECLF